MSIKTLLLAGFLSIAAVRAAQAGGASGAGGDIRGHASAAPACDTDQCPVLPTEGPGGPGDDMAAALDAWRQRVGPATPATTTAAAAHVWPVMAGQPPLARVTAAGVRRLRAWAEGADSAARSNSQMPMTSERQAARWSQRKEPQAFASNFNLALSSAYFEA